MPQFQITFTNDLILTYDLDMSVLAVENWMKEIVKFGPEDLCPINYKIKTGDKTVIAGKIERLYELADNLNSIYPGSIIKEEFIPGHEQEILNRMHVHFPEMHSEKYDFSKINKYAAEYNLLIHSLEGDFGTKSSEKFVLILNIHRSLKGFTKHKFNEKDYLKFQPFNPFGSLTLQYAQVGRNSQELYNAKDLVCPKHQYVPQDDFTASCCMYFGVYPKYSDAIVNKWKEQYLKGWEEFYKTKGGKDFFDCAIDDPKIRFGSVRIGNLVEATLDNKNYNFQTFIEEKIIQKMILTNDVKSFTILE